MNDDKLRQAALQVAAKTGIKTTKRRLRVVGDAAPPKMTALQRDVLYAQVRDIGNLHSLNWLVRQETAHVMGVLECLSDDDLHALLAKLNRGVEARMDGVPFAEVGLIRGADCMWVA